MMIQEIRCMNGVMILAIRYWQYDAWMAKRYWRYDAWMAIHYMDGDAIRYWWDDDAVFVQFYLIIIVLFMISCSNLQFVGFAAFHFILVESIMLWWFQCLTDECSDFSTLFSIAIHWIQLLVWLAVTGWWFCHTVSSLRIFDGLLVLLFPWFIGSNFLTSIRQQNYVSTNVIHCEFFALCT